MAYVQRGTGTATPKDLQFSKITEHLAIRIGLVFTGEQAIRAGLIKWPEAMTHCKPARPFRERQLPPTRKFYIAGKVQEKPGPLAVHFALQQLEVQMLQFGLAEDRIEFDIRRLGGKAACARDGERMLWGFGRPHPTKPDFRPNGEFAGPLVDHRPGQRNGWKFRPVYVGVKDGTTRYRAKMTTRWSDHQITVVVEKNPSSVPPELARYARLTVRPIATA